MSGAPGRPLRRVPAGSVILHVDLGRGSPAGAAASRGLARRFLWYRGAMGTGRGRRLAIRLVACAVIGAVVTVGVAWLSFLWGLPAGARPVAPPRWMSTTPPGWPQAPIGESRQDGLGITRRSQGAMDATSRYSLTELKAGWPAPSMMNRERAEYRWDTYTPNTPPQAPALPLRPLFPGFALDTAFYAAIAFTLWSAPGVIRRRLRRARGRCPACGYDLRGSTSAVCPECGVAPKREGVAEGRGGEEVPSASAHDG
jgi:hypothetical protein